MLKQFLFTSFFYLISLIVFSQNEDGWKVYHNKQLAFEATNADEAKNKLVFQQADLKKEGYVLISYQEAQPKKNWKRTFSINNEADSTLMKKEGLMMIRLLHSEIKKLLKNHSKIIVYTWSLPKDPKQAALVRVRRIQLCTIELR